jgi:hypothetical protein
MKELTDERDRFQKEHELMTIENKTFERQKSDAEERM